MFQTKPDKFVTDKLWLPERSDSGSTTPVTDNHRVISYAQNFEDVILHRAFRNKTDGFYIDVGAMDPVHDSVTKFFYELGWCGINVEPNRYFYERLVADRPRDVNLNVALGEREELRSLHVFEQYGLTTFDPNFSQRNAERGFEPKTQMVETKTLRAICDEHVQGEVHFLKVDCEGWEGPVLKGADWDRFQPVVVIVEATEPGTTNPSWVSWDPILVGGGHYEMVYYDGLNRFYLHRAHNELKSCFELPPNIYDSFKLYATDLAEQAHEECKRELQEAIWRAGVAAQEAQRAHDRVDWERTNLAAKLSQVEQNLECSQAECDKVKQALIDARLWVGRLSQELAALRRT